MTRTRDDYKAIVRAYLVSRGKLEDKVEGILELFLGYESDIQKELAQRCTAEVSNGIVMQVTQALSESETDVYYLMFGELKKQSTIHIEEACARCDHCHFKTVKQCQDFQAKEAKARGFNKLICPSQLINKEAK